ncbi:MAG: four helix bundle protein [Acidobacteria bacterium]|nr:four helix bundle protein [Acidobacteriota bacterium]
MEKGFHAYEVALGLMVGLRPLHDALRLHDRDLADQLRRAGSSVVLNLGEGAGRRGRDRMQFYRIAQGSARELRAALDVARAWGEIPPAPEVEGLLDRLLAMLWRLTHPGP